MDARPRLLDRVRDQLRKLHYSNRTEQQYLFWIRRFILFHGKRHPSDMAAREVEEFLTHLAVDRKVSASTQNQALAAILFLYQKVMQVELPWLVGNLLYGARLPAHCGAASHLDDVKLPHGAGALEWRALAVGCRHTSGTRARLRHAHRAGTARTQGCEDDADLHACDAQGRECGAESAGSVSANATSSN